MCTISQHFELAVFLSAILLPNCIFIVEENSFFWEKWQWQALSPFKNKSQKFPYHFSRESNSAPTGSVLYIRFVSFVRETVFLAGASFLRIKLKILEMNIVRCDRNVTQMDQTWCMFPSDLTMLEQTSPRATLASGGGFTAPCEVRAGTSLVPLEKEKKRYEVTSVSRTSVTQNWLCVCCQLPCTNVTSHSAGAFSSVPFVMETLVSNR